MTAAAFTARYVKAISRADGDVHFSFMVPAEFHKGPLDMLGGMVPPGNAPVYVAIAILKDPPSTQPAKVEKPKGPTPSQRAWRLCETRAFREWFAEAFNYAPGPVGASDCADYLRGHLGVESRGELDSNPEARARFEQLEKEYQEAMR